MNRYLVWSLPVALLLAFGSTARSADMSATPLVRVLSPNGQVGIELLLQRHQESEAVPHYRVSFKDQPIIGMSRLRIDLADGPPLGGSCLIESVATHSCHTEYAVFPGKRRHVLDHGTETVVALRERTLPGRRWELVLRAYDDGVAFRYRFPAQKGWASLVIAGEGTEFALPDDARAYALPLNSFTTSYEKYYQKKPVTEIPKNWLL